VDLIYPENLHLEHNSFPLAPHRLEIDYSMLSQYSADCLDFLRGPQAKSHKSKKLVTTFLPRENYVIHSANLALYLKLGMQLVCVRKGIEFVQSRFLKEYIDYCTSKRAASKSAFKKNLFKNMSNSCFGKFIENSRAYIDCHLVNNGADFKKQITSHRFSAFTILNSSVTAMFLKRKEIYMKQAWAVGFTILERSKWLMYDQFYNKIKPALKGKVTCNMTDTDSLLFTAEGYSEETEVMKILSHLMDTSNYAEDHPLFDSARKNQLTYWKDELCGNELVEFAGLASKSYSMRVKTKHDTVTSSKCKGVRKGYRKKIAFLSFKNCVDSISAENVSQYNIVGKSFKLFTVKTKKRAFSSFDDKRYILPCAIHTLAHGSSLIRSAKDSCLFCKKSAIPSVSQCDV
jgi:hypothetical protein